MGNFLVIYAFSTKNKIQLTNCDIKKILYKKNYFEKLWEIFGMCFSNCFFPASVFAKDDAVDLVAKDGCGADVTAKDGCSTDMLQKMVSVDLNWLIVFAQKR